MSLTLESWRQQAHKKLQTVDIWLPNGTAHPTYSAAAGLALWPLATATHKWSFVVVIHVLHTLTGEMAGADAIAAQLMVWKNQPHPPTETDVIAWAAHQTERPHVREALDTILEKVMPFSEVGLSEAARMALSEELAQLGHPTRLAAMLTGSGAVAQDGGKALGQQAVEAGQTDGSIVTGAVDAGEDFIGRDKIMVIAASGSQVVFRSADTASTPALDHDSALSRYLSHVINLNRYLQLQGIRSGGRLVHIELEQIYITLRATQQRTIPGEDRWLSGEAMFAPGERHRRETMTETVTVSVNDALAAHRHLVVLGDPGSGKTTLLRYLALIYARALAEGRPLVSQTLGLPEDGKLPILLPLRQIGAFLQAHGDESTEGHALLLQFWHQYLRNERLNIPPDFLDAYLERGEAVIFLDGLDEVAGVQLRRRVARLVDALTRAYPDCRFVVTSRLVGYTGSARLGEAYALTTVREFTLVEVETFLRHWHQLAAVAQLGVGPDADHYAQQQTAQLMAAIRRKGRIRELAINPLMLTVIALVHRDRVKLPDRRAELYAEAVDVLLGKWDEARGVSQRPILTNRAFDTGDKRLMLQRIALHMHAHEQKEIETEALRRLLFDAFAEMVPDKRAAVRAVDAFLQVIQERTGLLVERGVGVYAFSHLTFQEYLAALAIVAEEDCVATILEHTADSWWQEPILLAVGILSGRSQSRTVSLIQAIARPETPQRNVGLAVACLQDVGQDRVPHALAEEITQQLQADMVFDVAEAVRAQTPQSRWGKWWQNQWGEPFDAQAFRQAWTQRKVAAATAMGQMRGYGQQTYWQPPYGEPEWVEIPAGEFVMGSQDNLKRDGEEPHKVDDDEKPQHRLHLDTFSMAKVPTTNAQYALFVEATGHKSPRHWQDGEIPKGLESHPVINVSWQDAMAYCDWLSQVTGKQITLPSEAEWEKAARGTDGRLYPWGDTFDKMRGNTGVLGIGTTTPVGIFPHGASPYGVLDMCGNVWEWTRSLYRKYDREKWEKERKLNSNQVDNHRF